MASAKHSFASTGNIELQRGGQRVLVGQYAFGSSESSESFNRTARRKTAFRFAWKPLLDTASQRQALC
jgi:hypothetical protein